MIMLLLNNKFRFKQIILGKKVHNSSYEKMLDIFKDVSVGFAKAVNIFSKIEQKNEENIYDTKYNGIRMSRNCRYMNKMIKEYDNYFQEMNLNVQEYEKIQQVWLQELLKYEKNINDFFEYEKLSKYFICYSLAFWKKFKNKTAKECEEEIWHFAKKLRGLTNGISNK